MIIHLSVLLAGFSIFSCFILLMAYLFFLPAMRKSASGKIACTLLLCGLVILQIAHYAHVTTGIPLLEYRIYGGLLMLVPPAFFFFSRVILFPDAQHRSVDLLHALPLLLTIIVPVKTLPAIAFVIGTAYTFWFAHTVYQLRNQRGRFKFEIFFFGMFALIAFAALILGLSLPYIDPSIFYLTYANAISLVMLLVVAALLFFPELLSDILLITELTYAKSKLHGLDITSVINDLDRLMSVEQHYQNEELSLTSLAENLGITPHQLSELINTKHGVGFPKFVRQHRVDAAKTLLVTEPTASILSISMMTGFNSQSNFYAAFKEITGVSPGEYRKDKV